MKFTHGEENVVMPVSESAQTGTAVDRLAEKAVLDAVQRYDPTARVSIVSPGRAQVLSDHRPVMSRAHWN